MQTNPILLLQLAETTYDGGIAIRDHKQVIETPEELTRIMDSARLFAECGIPAAVFRQEDPCNPRTRRSLAYLYGEEQDET